MHLNTRILLFVSLIISACAFSQKLTAKQLLDIWSISDKTQTIEALKAQDDLSNNYDPKKYNAIKEEIKKSKVIKKNVRLQSRFILYEANAEMFLQKKLDPELKKQLEESIKSALILNDEQLLTEIYSLFYEQGFGDPNEKLYYISKTVEMQEKIGAQYFPKLFFRYYNLSLGYYLAHEYNASIQKGLKGLKHIPSPKDYLDYYCFFLDILGTNYYQIGNYSKSEHYYSLLKTTLSRYKKEYATYKGRFSAYDKQFVEIWEGIAAGGLARVAIEKKEYPKAKELLEQNLITAEKYRLDNDIAKVHYLLGKIETKQNRPANALDYYKKSLDFAQHVNDEPNITNSLLGISESYRDLKQFENAYKFNVQYNAKKAEIEKDLSFRRYSTISEKLKQENLRNSIRKADATIKRQNTIRNMTILLCFIVILGIGVAYRMFYFKQKLKYSLSENQRLQVEKQLEDSQKESKIAELQLEQFRQKLARNQKIIEAIGTENSTTTKLNKLKETTILTTEDWMEFKKQFEKAFPNFLTDLKETNSELTQSELRFLCLAQLGLNNSEIASALGVSPASLRVTKHRIRKKTGAKEEDFPFNLVKIQD